jgi:c-di-GMP-binding flagellar brake protein YcgR
MEKPDLERRRYPRIKIKVPIEVVCLNMPPMRTATDEISLSGCYIETMFTFEVGTGVEIIFFVGAEKLRVKGTVVTKYPQVGNGIDFVEIAPQDREKLAEWVSDSKVE